MKLKFQNGKEAEVGLELDFVCKADGDDALPATDDLSARDSGNPADPTRELIEKAQLPVGSTTVTDAALYKMLFADADVRDKEPSIVTLRKDVSVPDWSWSTAVSGRSTSLEKRSRTLPQEKPPRPDGVYEERVGKALWKYTYQGGQVAKMECIDDGLPSGKLFFDRFGNEVAA